MITEGEAAILLEMTQRAFHNQSQSKQRSTLIPENQPVGSINCNFSATYKTLLRNKTIQGSVSVLKNPSLMRRTDFS